jgi:actin-related protein 10
MVDVDHPSSDAAQSESEFSRVSMDVDSPAPGSRIVSSSYSIVSGADSHGTSSSHPGEHGGSQVLADLYKRHSTASDIQIQVTPPASSGGLGRGVLMIPGWIRERAAEVLFEGGDVDEVSIAEVILESLLKASFLSCCTPTVPGLTSSIPLRFQSTFGRQWLLQSWLLAVPL